LAKRSDTKGSEGEKERPNIGGFVVDIEIVALS
jgi:hypothetical protein